MKPSLAAHFRTYADYHKHPMNRLTHKIAIPLIVFHVVAMLDWVTLYTLPESGFRITLVYPILVAAIGWYFTLHAGLAVVMLLFYGVCIPIGWYVSDASRWIVVGLAVFAWLVQLAGHSVWEKNRPAFLTNLLQALIGPFFFAAVFLGVWPPKRAEVPAKA